MPCFRGSFASDKPRQDHRESVRTQQASHAFAVTLPALRFCKGSAKAWHPKNTLNSATGSKPSDQRSFFMPGNGNLSLARDNLVVLVLRLATPFLYPRDRCRASASSGSESVGPDSFVSPGEGGRASMRRQRRRSLCNCEVGSCQRFKSLSNPDRLRLFRQR